MKHPISQAFLLGISVLVLSSAMAAGTTGNRYGYPVLYQSEISSAKAWLNVSKEKSHEDGSQAEVIDAKKPVIIDVRRIEEYVAGHPPGAYSIPFPHVTGSPSVANDTGGAYIGYDISVDPDIGFLTVNGKDGIFPIQSFVDYVASVFPDKNQPIYLLCATGHRSVQAANALAKYGHYTQVRNIWEGYNGQWKYAYTGAAPTIPLVALDLNNDGVVDPKDRDGWAFYQELPTETKLDKELLFAPYITLYK
jgi:rhodanese-related sulfurtransferase